MSDNAVNNTHSDKNFGRFLRSVTLSSTAALSVGLTTSVFLINPLNKSSMNDKKSMSVYEIEKFN